MSKIDYQALREAAERAIPAMERLLMLPADDDLLSEQELKDYGVDIDALNAFKFLTGPETVLALLDERERNQQYIKRRDQENEDIALTVGRLRVEMEAAEKRIAELESLKAPQLTQQSVPDEMTPEMMRAVQLNSELGAYAASNLSGAYDLFSEFWKAACRAAMIHGAETVSNRDDLTDDFISMLTGRAKYLREKGEIKSPYLLERAAAALKGENADTTAIPNGWKLVPIDPTKDMLLAGQSVVGFWLNTVHCYSKMLAAAPAAPQQEVK